MECEHNNPSVGIEVGDDESTDDEPNIYDEENVSELVQHGTLLKLDTEKVKK